MDISTYLARLNYRETVSANIETLRGLHRAHMVSVPFENLDIGLGRKIQLNEPVLWNKIVVSKRGGFCYELNGMFAWLLRQIGFDVTCLNGRVYNREGGLGMDFDHLTLLVRVPGESTRQLADVGFGDSFMEPLNLEDDGEQPDGLRAYRLEAFNDGYNLWQRNYDGQWSRQYFFDLQPRRFPDDYEAGCQYHQTSPQSIFTRKSVISVATGDGRVTLEDQRLIVTKNGQREEKWVERKEEYTQLLFQHFGTVLQ